MLPFIITIILIVFIVGLLSGLDFRDPNLAQPCKKCDGEMQYVSLFSPASNADERPYRCKSCGAVEYRADHNGESLH
jgi:hypothetical protein